MWFRHNIRATTTVGSGGIPTIEICENIVLKTEVVKGILVKGIVTMISKYLP
jgi:hypothetical protein